MIAFEADVEAPISDEVVEFDPYVPILYRADARLDLGSRYLFARHDPHELLEFTVRGETMRLREFALLGAQVGNPYFLTGDGEVQDGVPVLKLPKGHSFTSGVSPRIDIQAGMHLSCNTGVAEIRIGSAVTFNSRVRHGRVQFLFQNMELVALRVTELAKREENILLAYIDERS